MELTVCQCRGGYAGSCDLRDVRLEVFDREAIYSINCLNLDGGLTATSVDLSKWIIVAVHFIHALTDTRLWPDEAIGNHDGKLSCWGVQYSWDEPQ